MPSSFPALAEHAALNQVTVPDLWQQQAVAALREGKDVVVQAPTGAGKTLIFELWSNQGKNRGQAIYTVPTRRSEERRVGKECRPGGGRYSGKKRKRERET